MNSVLTGPGQSAVAVTPVPFRSLLNTSVNDSTNAFEAEYVLCRGSGWNAGGRGDVHHRALAPLDHRGNVDAAQVDDRLDVRAHHAQLAIEVELLERTPRCRSRRC